MPTTFTTASEITPMVPKHSLKSVDRYSSTSRTEGTASSTTSLTPGRSMGRQLSAGSSRKPKFSAIEPRTSGNRTLFAKSMHGCVRTD
ncbi:MAG: hypothetical protein ACYC9S_10225 [Leptospirales bacterium]